MLNDDVSAQQAEDRYTAVCCLAELGSLAFKSALPMLSHDLLYSAVLVSLAEDIPASNLASIKDAVSNPELSGPERRCYGFLAAVVEHLGMAEAPPQSPKQPDLFPGEHP